MYVTITKNSNKITYLFKLGSIRFCSTLGSLSFFSAWNSSTCIEEESILGAIFSFVVSPSSICSNNKKRNLVKGKELIWWIKVSVASFIYSDAVYVKLTL